jgi:hypothetical protein
MVIAKLNFTLSGIFRLDLKCYKATLKLQNSDFHSQIIV